MSDQVKYSSPYPAGHIKYAFEMHVTHDKIISCKIPHPKVKELVFEKLNPADEFDPKWFLTIHLSEIYSIEEVQEIGNAIKDDVVDMLSFSLNTKVGEMKVVGYGLTPRPGEGGIVHLLMPPPEIRSTGKTGSLKLSSDNIQEIQDALLRMSSLKHKPLIRLFRYAISDNHPVVQFMILYLILYEMHKNQSEVDRYILKFAPTTPQSISPHTGNLETIYTKLRNEITHRTNVQPETAIAEIISNLDEFKKIVHITLKSIR
jgi:hypothetical protein